LCALHTAFSHINSTRCAHLQESQLARDNAAEAVQLAAELPQKHQPLVNKTRYATPASVQMRQLMRRFLLVYWRSPAYNVGPLLQHKADEQHACLPAASLLPEHGKVVQVCLPAGDEDDHDDLHLTAICTSPLLCLMSLTDFGLL
jgi:hypothetical protein